MDISISGSNRKRDEIRTFISPVNAAARHLKSVCQVTSERVSTSLGCSGCAWYVAGGVGSGLGFTPKPAFPLKGWKGRVVLGLVR